MPTRGTFGSGDIKLTGVSDVIHNVRIVSDALNDWGVRTIGAIGVDLLRRTLPRVPIETGELRESATVRLLIGKSFKNNPGPEEGIPIARGNADGTVTVEMQGLSGLSYRRKRVSFNIVFYRYNEKTNFDVAWFTHEYIAPYSMRPAKRGERGSKPAARTEGTGPKYLEGAYDENLGTYMKWLSYSIASNYIYKHIRSVSRTTGKGSQYTVDTIQLKEVPVSGIIGNWDVVK